METVLELVRQFRDETAAVITIATIVISTLSLLLAATAIWSQRRYEQASLRPLAHVFLGDFRDRIFVGLKNVGVGPMMIQKISFESAEGSIKTALIESMPKLSDGIKWKSYSTSLSGHFLGVNDSIEFIHLSGDEGDALFSNDREKIRSALANITVVVYYGDLYGNRFNHQKILSRFG